MSYQLRTPRPKIYTRKPTTVEAMAFDDDSLVGPITAWVRKTTVERSSGSRTAISPSSSARPSLSSWATS